MPLGGGNSNSRQNKMPVGKEVSTRLPESMPDRTSLFTTQSAIQVGTPSLVSYIRRKSHHIGESSSRLAGYLVQRVRRGLVASRAIHLPLLSRAFDYIRGKTALVSPVWQRMLDLPWVRQHRRPRRNSKRTTGATVDGKLGAVSPEQGKLYPDVLLQPLSDIEEEQVGGEADETYALAVDETYPSIISRNLLSQPVTKRTSLTGEVYPSVTNNVFSAPAVIERMADTTSEIPHYTQATNMPLDTKYVTGKHYLSESSQPPHITRKVKRTRTGNEVYPSVIKNLFSAPAITERVANTASDISRFIKHVIGSPEADDSLAQVKGQSRHIYKNQPLSRPLTPVQPLALQSSPAKGRSHVTREGIYETHALPQWYSSQLKTVESKVESESTIAKQPTLPFIAEIPKIGASVQPDAESTHIPLTLARHEQQGTLEHRRSHDASSGGRGPTIPGDARKRPRPSMITRTVKHFNEIISKTLLPETLTDSEGTAVLPDEVSHKRIPQAGQPPRQKPVVGPSVEPAGGQAGVISQAEGMTGVSQRADKLNLISLEHSSSDQGLIKGLVNKSLLHRGPLLFARRPVQELPVQESTYRMINLPYPQLFRSEAYASPSYRRESYGLLENRQYVTSSPDYMYSHQPALDLPVVSSIQSSVESSSADSEELFTDISNAMPAFSRNQNMPELALSPVRRAIETPSQSVIPEPRSEAAGEKVTTLDIDTIARDVYRILKRRLVSERERTLGRA